MKLPIVKLELENNSGKMIMRSNDETKKELGCSPDRGLCYIYGIYGLKRVIPSTRKEYTFASRSGAMAISPMAMLLSLFFGLLL